MQRADNVRLAYDEPRIFRQGVVAVIVGTSSHALGRMTPDQWDAAQRRQLGQPNFVASIGGQNLWQFQAKFYWDSDGLNESEIHALLAGEQQHSAAIVVPGSKTASRFIAHHSEPRPPWMHGGSLEASLGEGKEDLAVVGESYHQDNLWRIVGPKRRGGEYIREPIYAMPLAEVGNPYDENAVAVWIDGLRVGHLSRDDARRLRPGLLALQEKQGKPVALQGVIAGGGVRQDGPGMLGVFLAYDPEDFGLQRPRVVMPDARVRTALSDAIASDEADDSYDLSWLHELPSDDVRAIAMLRKLLATESELLDRHFMHAHLEAALYRCREVFASALDEYDAACRQHDAEMDGIRSACIAKWGKVPLLELYRQMAIRQQKRHDYRQALWWAERGLAVYDNEAARPEAIQDLRDRAARYRAKLA